MLFKDVQASTYMYLFDRGDISFKQGKVTSFTPSHIDIKVPSGKMVVDVTVQFEDKTQTYTVEDGLSVAFFGTAAISPDREAVLREVEALKQTSEMRLASRERDEEVVTKCNQLLMDNNPALKEKRETEARFSKIEEGQKSLNSKLDDMVEMMRKLMG